LTQLEWLDYGLGDEDGAVTFVDDAALLFPADVVGRRWGEFGQLFTGAEDGLDVFAVALGETALEVGLRKGLRGGLEGRQ
jgi:hypothetical protein